MKTTYFDLVEQTYYFPQSGFDLKNDYLTFNGISIKYLIEKYSTPFKIVYLPSIEDKIKKVRNLFKKAFKQESYNANYNFCYCTKCCHFKHVVNAALKQKVNLETSSSFDIDLIRNLYATKKISKDIYLIHNAYKTDNYILKIIELQKEGFYNSIIILDSKKELKRCLEKAGNHKLKIGLRMAVNEAPHATYHISRFGIRQNELLDFYNNEIKNNENVELKQLHFFVDTGIKDNFYYWNEFQKALSLYIDLKKNCDTLSQFNIGGGFPIRNHLGFNYDYEHIIKKIVSNIKLECSNNNISEPDIFTEFGKYTVGESGANIFKVLEQKKQNENELWYLIDNSLINTIPDSWSIHEKFILLPINKWNNQYTVVNIGGISCDNSDYYNSEDLNQQILLPTFSDTNEEPLYIGFFHTGAYQDAISGYGGIKHCLIPSPKLIIIDRDEKGNFVDYLYREEQTVKEMFNILGYNK